MSAFYESLLARGEIGPSEPYTTYSDETIGEVYIIHLSRPLAGSRSQHYIGFSKKTEKRLYHHRHNTGSNFLREANRQGIPYTLVVRFAGTKLDERRLKNCKNTARYCTCCNPGKTRQYKPSTPSKVLPHESHYTFCDL